MQLSGLHQPWLHLKKKIKENNEPHQRSRMKTERAFSTRHISRSSSLILNLNQPLAATDDHCLPYLGPSAPTRVASPIPPPLEAADSAGPSHTAFWTQLQTAAAIVSSKAQRAQRRFRITSALPNACCGS